jgi:hypothetical protein
MRWPLENVANLPRGFDAAVFVYLYVAILIAVRG